VDISYFSLEALLPATLYRGDGTGFNFHDAVIIKIRFKKKKLQSSNQVTLNIAQ